MIQTKGELTWGLRFGRNHCEPLRGGRERTCDLWTPLELLPANCQRTKIQPINVCCVTFSNQKEAHKDTWLTKHIQVSELYTTFKQASSHKHQTNDPLFTLSFFLFHLFADFPPSQLFQSFCYTLLLSSPAIPPPLLCSITTSHGTLGQREAERVL